MTILSYKVLPILLGVVLLAGCGSDNLSYDVEKHNYHTERVLTLYGSAKQGGVEVRSTFIEAIKTQDELLFSKVTASRNTDVSSKFVEGVTQVMYAIDTYIDDNNNYVKITLEDGDEPITDMITDSGAFTESILTEKYFLDDTTGTTEQMLLVELPSGKVTGLSVYWLGGVVYDVKALD